MERIVFVPNGPSRRETAELLVGTAGEFGISQKSILVRPSGFFITEELADLIYDESDHEAEAPKPAPAKKTSGNRAAKNDSKKKE